MLAFHMSPFSVINLIQSEALLLSNHGVFQVCQGECLDQSHDSTEANIRGDSKKKRRKDENLEVTATLHKLLCSSSTVGWQEDV